MSDKLVKILHVNGVEVKILKNQLGHFYTEVPEHAIFLSIKFPYKEDRSKPEFDTIFNISSYYNSFRFGYLPSSDEIQDIFIKNPLNFDEKALKNYYLKNYIIQNPPSKLKYIVDITELIDFNERMVKIFDMADWSKHDDSSRMKIIRKISNLYNRKSARAELLRSFDCVGKISDPKIGIELSKLLKSVGNYELYAKALSKFGVNDVLGKIIETGNSEVFYKVYKSETQKMKKAYHPEMIKTLPKIIHLVDLDFIKEFEELDEVKWNLFGTEYAPSIKLKGASLDVVNYLINKIEVENKTELLDYQIQILSKEKDFEKKVLQIKNMYELIKNMKLD